MEVCLMSLTLRATQSAHYTVTEQLYTRLITEGLLWLLWLL